MNKIVVNDFKLLLAIFFLDVRVECKGNLQMMYASLKYYLIGYNIDFPILVYAVKNCSEDIKCKIVVKTLHCTSQQINFHH